VRNRHCGERGNAVPSCCDAKQLSRPSWWGTPRSALHARGNGSVRDARIRDRPQRGRCPDRGVPVFQRYAGVFITLVPIVIVVLRIARVSNFETTTAQGILESLGLVHVRWLEQVLSAVHDGL